MTFPLCSQCGRRLTNYDAEYLICREGHLNRRDQVEGARVPRPPLPWWPALAGVAGGAGVVVIAELARLL